MSIVYSYKTWKIKKIDDEYHIYNGRKKIDSEVSFDEAYNLLDKYRKSIK